MRSAQHRNNNYNAAIIQFLSARMSFALTMDVCLIEFLFKVQHTSWCRFFSLCAACELT